MSPSIDSRGLNKKMPTIAVVGIVSAGETCQGGEDHAALFIGHVGGSFQQRSFRKNGLVPVPCVDIGEGTIRGKVKL